MKCPKCGEAVDTRGKAPGSSVTCMTCGNVTATPKSRKVLYIVLGLAGVVLACPCIGIGAAVAIPSFVRYEGRAKQAECKTNLKVWYTSQRVSQSGFFTSIAQVGFSPERGNRYAYFAGPGPIEDRSGAESQGTASAVGVGVDTFKNPKATPVAFEALPADLANELGVTGECPDGAGCAVTMACAGDIDGDETLDVWSISTQDRKDANGDFQPAGTPVQHVNDVTD
ncbi:fimbrial protein [Myxococcaceae bacterium GXIMD 01537]